KQQLAQQQNQEQAHQDQELQIDAILRQVLSPEAKSRLSNIKLVNKELYAQVLQSILYIAKSGRLAEKISDQQLKTLLEKISGAGRKEITIKRK
ncbi:MAG: DNA-binding protein, partial [Candidatus Diapherotrites archaeon]|nr:DNA-binding protein [Candidatus Diapherotrites archaeon]